MRLEGKFDGYRPETVALVAVTSTTTAPSKSPLYLDPWQNQLLDVYQIEVPIISWPAAPRRLLRISAQLYNSLPQYEKLAGALRELVGR